MSGDPSSFRGWRALLPLLVLGCCLPASTRAEGPPPDGGTPTALATPEPTTGALPREALELVARLVELTALPTGFPAKVDAKGRPVEPTQRATTLAWTGAFLAIAATRLSAEHGQWHAHLLNAAREMGIHPTLEQPRQQPLEAALYWWGTTVRPW